MPLPSDTVDACFRGDRLFGDDFGLEELERWYKEEEYGYYQLSSESNKQEFGSAYGYNALNWWYAFRFLGGRKFAHCVGLGAAKADDIVPLAPQIKQFTIIEPAEEYWSNTIGGKPAVYLKPSVAGELPLASGSVDLVTALGALHHIANVSTVIREIGRVLAPGGLFVFREPIHSMGDWRMPRSGLTRNERGIPANLISVYLNSAELDVVRWRYCMFAPFSKLNAQHILKSLWNYRWLMPIDQVASYLFSWNLIYHRTSLFRKVAPHCVFCIARRR